MYGKPADLLPCPFCGGSAEIWRAHENRPAWIACMGRCAVLITKEHDTDDAAVASWNTRTPGGYQPLGDPDPDAERAVSATPNQVVALASAMDQVLDDMGSDRQSVCLYTKAKARIAFDPFLDPDCASYVMPLDAAKQVVEECDANGWMRYRAAAVAATEGKS